MVPSRSRTQVGHGGYLILHLLLLRRRSILFQTPAEDPRRLPRPTARPRQKAPAILSHIRLRLHLRPIVLRMNMSEGVQPSQSHEGPPWHRLRVDPGVT